MIVLVSVSVTIGGGEVGGGDVSAARGSVVVICRESRLED